MSTSKKPVRRRLPSIDWQSLTFMGGWVDRPDGRSLFVYVAGIRQDAWIALAVEGPGRGDLRAILDDHGHRLIGEFANLPAARRAVEDFSRRWRRSRARVEECACDEVAA